MLLRTRARAGFTLIELLVVVVIIGILATIATNGYLGAMDRARDSGMISNTRSVQLGIENWKTDNSGLPATLLGTGPSVALAPDSGTPASAFPVAYLPGNRVPLGPWSKTPQNTNGDWGNASGSDVSALNAGSAYLVFSQGIHLQPGTNYLVDGDQGKTGLVESPPNQRRDYGYLYFLGDTGSGQYAVFGVGKGTGAQSNHPWVVAVKSNF